MNNNWNTFLYEEKNKKYYINIKKFILNEIRCKKIILPNINLIFNAFKWTKFDNLKVIILGQDPYYKNNLANGLAFSVNIGINIPKSLLNIYKEIYRSINNFKYPDNGFLIKWSLQGVLLLNSCLTVELNKPKSHSNIGWNYFILNLIKFININKNNIIFLLLGHDAKKFSTYINIKKHYILETSHPSPLSFNKGFYGCNHFNNINNILSANNINIINWQI